MKGAGASAALELHVQPPAPGVQVTASQTPVVTFRSAPFYWHPHSDANKINFQIHGMYRRPAPPRLFNLWTFPPFAQLKKKRYFLVNGAPVHPAIAPSLRTPHTGAASSVPSAGSEGNVAPNFVGVALLRLLDGVYIESRHRCTRASARSAPSARVSLYSHRYTLLIPGLGIVREPSVWELHYFTAFAK